MLSSVLLKKACSPFPPSENFSNPRFDSVSRLLFLRSITTFGSKKLFARSVIMASSSTEVISFLFGKHSILITILSNSSAFNRRFPVDFFTTAFVNPAILSYTPSFHGASELIRCHATGSLLRLQ